MASWIEKFVGIPYKLGGTSPRQGMDCWSFFKYVQSQRFGKEFDALQLEEGSLKAIAAEFRNGKEIRHWRPVSDMRDGDAVVMSLNTVAHHVGIIVTDGASTGVLHAVDGIGSMFMTHSRLRSSGWNVLGYYRHDS